MKVVDLKRLVSCNFFLFKLDRILYYYTSFYQCQFSTEILIHRPNTFLMNILHQNIKRLTLKLKPFYARFKIVSEMYGIYSNFVGLRESCLVSGSSQAKRMVSMCEVYYIT